MRLHNALPRLLPALLFALLAMSFPAAAQPPTCGDFLAEIQAKPEHLEFLECTQGKDAQLRVLKARYRVVGTHAAEVEEYFVRKSGMARLQYNCCGWENWPEHPTDRHDGALPHNLPLNQEDPTERDLAVSMSTGETLKGSTRDRWKEIDWFYVDVLMYLESP